MLLNLCYIKPWIFQHGIGLQILHWLVVKTQIILRNDLECMTP